MKFSFIVLALISTAFLPVRIHAQSCTMQGVYSVGPTGNYNSLTNAIAALKATGLSNPVVLELQPTYQSTGELFPLSFSGIPCIDSTRNITIRPATGATNLVISTSTALTIDLSNARFITFDGRAGGSGTTKALTISNSSSSGITVRFINDASWNQLEYLNILGVNKSSTSGVVSFLTSNQTISNGNNNNRLVNCIISKGASEPVNCVFSQGSNNKKNSGNEIVDCAISDFYAASGTSNGIYLGANSADWRLSGNSIFHSVQKNFNNLVAVTAIYINDTTSSGFTVENNFVGGSAPSCAGSPISYGTNYNSIRLMVGNNAFTSVQNNTIANLNLDFILTGSEYSAILLGMGKFRCGDIAGNTIGNPAVSNSITARMSNNSFAFYGIKLGMEFPANSGVDTCYVKNNKFAGIYIYLAADVYLGCPLYCIAALEQKKGYFDISNNFIGSLSVPRSIRNESFGPGNPVYGVNATTNSAIPISSQPKNLISNNTVVNLNGQAFGIRTGRGSYRILNNQVHHLYGASANTASLLVRGILCEAGNDNTVVSGNTIHSLTSPGTSVNDIAGIDVRNSPGALVTKNYIHSLQSAFASGNDITGINIATPGRVYVINNMVRLGRDTLGNAVSGNQKIFGIQLINDSAYVSHNTVYIGASGTGESAALMLPSDAASAGTVINNILVNKRSATQGSPRYHYAIRIDNAGTNLSKLNYNLYYAAGTNAYLGIYKGINQSTIINWRKAIAADSNSLFYDPHLVNPEGNAINGDLHLQNNTPAEGSGILDPFTTEDFDNEIRSSLSPTDIGADAGNYVFQDGDAPVLTHQAFFGQAVSPVVTYAVKIIDNGSGVDTTTVNKPRMWFRKKYSSITGWTSVVGDLASGTINNGVWNFTPEFAAAGISLTPGDSIEYYFVAQDKGIVPNIGYSNLAGVSHSSVTIQLSAPTTPLRLLIYGIFPDTIYVGAGQMYTSLTKKGGFFEASHKNMFDSTHVSGAVVITSDLLEDGTYDYTTLSQKAPFVTFYTNTAVVKQIKADYILKSMIRVNGAKNLSIDGRVRGSGRYLQFTNFSGITGGGDVCMSIGNVTNFSLINTILETNGGPNESGNNCLTVAGTINKALIQGNLLRQAAGGKGLPLAGMFLGLNLLDTLRIVQNEITNFRTTGIDVIGGFLNTGAVIFDSNHLYFDQGVSPVGSINFFYFNTTVLKAIISNNFVGGTAPYCGGSPLAFNVASNNATVNGMYFYVSGEQSTSIQGNTIQNFSISQYGYTFTGIVVATGSFDIGNVKGNTIGSIAGIGIVNKQAVYGITGNVGANLLTRIENNTISGFEGSYICAIDWGSARGIVRNNKFSNSRVFSGASFGVPGFTGMKIGLGEGNIEGNEVSGISTLTDLSNSVGMDIRHSPASTLELTVHRNKIHNLKNVSTNSAITLIGLQGETGASYFNNQINIDNGNDPTPIGVIGMNMSGNATNNFKTKICYNTIRVGGNAIGSNNSYAFRMAGTGPVSNFRNNICYNERTGGSGRHFAYGENATGAVVWGAGPAPNNNLYVTADTSYVNEWRSSGAVSMSQWRGLMRGDTASYASNFIDVPASQFFLDPAAGNLNINSSNPLCWYVNGKGLPFSDISGDYDIPTAIRSTSITTGATDIGSDEFTTSTLPPILVVSGNHANQGTEIFSINGRTIASITWGASGVIPTLGPARFYSGVWPNDTTNNSTISGSKYMNSYWEIPASGGSNYSYDLTLFYDSSMLGKVTDASAMVVNKRQINTPGTWTVIIPTTVNTSLKTITVTNQTSFSEFTSTSSSATLVNGVPLPDLVITNQNLNPSTAGTGETVTVDFTVGNQGEGPSPAAKVYYYLSADNILTPGANGDILLDNSDINSISVNSNSGGLTRALRIPCSISPGNFYLFIVADGGNTVVEKNENNNLVFMAVTVTPGLTLPAPPLITVTPSSTVCSPEPVTITAVSPNCIGCVYNWSNGATGISTTVSNSGIYAVTVSNACGTITATQAVSVNPVPGITLSATATSICTGGTVTLTSSGATNYSWSGSNLNSTTGASVIASPATPGKYTYSVTGTSNGCSQTQMLIITVIPAPSVTIAQKDTSICEGSSVTLRSSASTGNQWYRNDILINGALSETYVASMAGNYKVVFNDGICSATSSSVVINVLPKPVTPTVTASGPISFCVGSNVILSSSASSGNQWYKDGILISGATAQNYTASQSGSFTVVTTGSNCSSSPSSAVIVSANPVPAAPVITYSGAATFCNGQSLVLNSSASSGNQWIKDGVAITAATGQSFTATENGVYSVTQSIGGCTSLASTGVTATVNPVPPTPVITAGGPTSFCEGGSVVLTSSSTSGSQWYKDGIVINGASGSSYTTTQSGNYSVKLSANGCTSAFSNGITVTVNGIPATPVITQSGNTLVSSSNSGNQWYKNGVAIPGATAASYSPVETAQYSVSVTLNACTSAQSSAISFVVTAISSPVLDKSIQVFPSPVRERLTIKHNGILATLKIRLVDLHGRELTQKLFTRFTELDMKNLPAGTYIVDIMNLRTKEHVQRLVTKL